MAVAGIAFNVLGNWVLVFGNLGAPALGLVGAGVASALASLCLFLGLALVVLRDRRFRRYRLFGNLLQPDWQRLAAFWKLGLPIGVATAFEVTIFNAAAFLIGWLGEAELAAHAIAIQIASVTFMIPYGVAQAATVRVSHAQGAGDASGVARAGWSAFGLGIGSMAIAALLMVTVPYLLVSAFMDVRDPANARVLGFAVGYLAVAAIFQIVDGAQVLGAGMLRGLHDTRVPMVYAAIGYWGVGLPSGAWLAFEAGWRGVGIWSGLAIGLTVVAVLMVQRWTRRERLGLVRARPDVHASAHARKRARRGPACHNRPSVIWKPHARHPAPAFPPLNAERLWSRVETLSRYTLPGQPWTRRASPLFDEARAWLRQEFQAAGLATRLDAGGNLVGARAGSDPRASPSSPARTATPC